MTIFGFPVADVVALGVSIGLWMSFALIMDYSRWRVQTLTHAVNAERYHWMLRLTERENRVNDGGLIGSLMRSVSFFASASIIILGGVTAALGAVDRGEDTMRALPFLPVISKELLEVKLAVIGLVFVYSFFKFTWSLRQFNYCCILVGGAPSPDASLEIRRAFAKRATRVNELGGRSFNEGLRGYYFALATMGWFVHPLAFVGATLWVVWILWRREFRSRTRQALRDHQGS